MEDVVGKLLPRHKDIQVTFAGPGPDLDRLKRRFAHDSRVRFTSFEPYDSITVHAGYDIGVVQTSCCARLTSKTGQGIRPIDNVFGQYL